MVVKKGEGLATGAMDTQQIMGMLKHRYPFLFVDRVIDCVPGHHIVGIKNISGARPWLGRGCAGKALPALILIEALAQVSVILTFKTLRLEPSGQELMFFAGIDKGRFYGEVVPGDVLHLRVEVGRLRKSMGWFRATAYVEDRCVAEMAMLAAIKLG